MTIGKKILPYKDAIMNDLAKLVAIPSVCTAPEDGKPFGKESARALQEILRMAKDMGFAVKNVGNYAGHAEYGEGSESAAVIAHVDVVPAGDGWNSDPFRLTQKGNLWYGRGAADDKGAAVAALYCLKALKDAGVTGKRKIRVIFGAGEEIASDDLAMYFNSEPMPVMAFTPDSDYGICNREKGILRVKLSADGKSVGKIHSITAGTVVNAVPDKAEAVVPVEFEEKLRAAAAKFEGQFRFEETSEGVKILSFGKACHAMQPEAGFNAATHLIALLTKALSADELGAFPAFLNQTIGTETDGASMGVCLSDEPSGPLTLNVGLVRINSASADVTIDIRYPVTLQGKQIFRTIREKTEKAAFRADMLLDNEPLYFPEDHPLVHLLQDAYCAVKGVPAEVYATGGGTYAREVPGRAVAFGPFFPDEPDRGLHNANENIDINRFMEHAQICLEAMYRMMTL